VCIEIVRLVRPCAEKIARFDRDLARQQKRSSVSVVLNVAKASGNGGGRRRQAYEIALGEARETRAALHAAQAIGYLPEIGPELLDGLDRVIATLVKLVR
jgi:four helix bundle protein